MKWTWPGEDPPYGPMPSVEIEGNKLIWNLEADHDRKRGGDHAEQTFEDFRTYGPSWTYAPVDILDKLVSQSGLEDPPWRQPGYDPYPEAWHAITKGDEGRALELTASGKDLDHRYRHGTTLLMHAAAKGMVQLVGELLRSSAVNVNSRNDRGQSAVVLACWEFRPPKQMIALLLDAGATDLDGALEFAIQRGNRDIAELLVDRGAKLAEFDHLLDVARGGWLSVMRSLLASGANPTFCSQQGSTPLLWAQSAEMIQLLLDSGADPNYKTPDGETALSVACTSGLAMKADLLLKAGADPNARAYHYEFRRTRGEPILQCLLDTKRYPEIVAMLLAAGADPDLK